MLTQKWQIGWSCSRFVVTPYLGKCVQPIGVYVTSGTANALALQSLIIKVVMASLKNNAIVTKVVFNGHSTNKCVHYLFYVSVQIWEV